jgi:hypothetical protein
VASNAAAGGSLVLKNKAGAILASVVVPSTGGWQKWITLTDSSRTVTLPTGLNTVRLSFVGTGTQSLFNLNWFELGESLVETRIPHRRAATTWDLEGRRLRVRSSAGAGSQVRLRALDGRILASAPVGPDGATLEAPERGVVLGEIAGPAGREVRKLLVH